AGRRRVGIHLEMTHRVVRHARRARSAAALPLTFEDPYDRDDRTPTPRRRRRTEQLVDLTEIADGFHVTPVHPEDESILRPDDAHEPLPARRNGDWNRSRYAPRSRQDAHESNDVRARRLGAERIVRLQTDEIAAVA